MPLTPVTADLLRARPITFAQQGGKPIKPGGVA